jgi:hypothetical protein
MTSSFHDVGQLTNCIRIPGRKAGEPFEGARVGDPVHISSHATPALLLDKRSSIN